MRTTFGIIINILAIVVNLNTGVLAHEKDSIVYWINVSLCVASITMIAVFVSGEFKAKALKEL